MPSPHGLADRIRRARNDAGLRQRELAAKLGVDLRTVQGWESGRVPRGDALTKLERALSVDLTSPPESQAPRLDEATDAQVVADLANRLADRDRIIRDLRRQLDSRQDAPVADITSATGRWAARTRDNGDPTK